MGSLHERLSLFAPLIDRTFRGTFSTSTPEKPMHDVMRWERILNGNAVRITHSVNRGEYGGETIVIPDPDSRDIVYYYFTTAGFHSQGVITPSEGGYRAQEELTGNENGVTAVTADSTLGEDTVHVKARYLKQGEWVDGHEIYYERAPDAVPVFR